MAPSFTATISQVVICCFVASVARNQRWFEHKVEEGHHVEVTAETTHTTTTATPTTTTAPTTTPNDTTDGELMTSTQSMNDLLNDELSQLLALVAEDISMQKERKAEEEMRRKWEKGELVEENMDDEGGSSAKMGRGRRSAFVPVFSVLYFDLKRRGAKLHELTHENRQMISKLSHIVANNTFLSAKMSNRLSDIYYGNNPAAHRAFRSFHEQYVDHAVQVQRGVMASNDRYTRLVEGDGELDLTAMGHSIPLTFLTRPSIAFVAGCAFNLLTVLLCFFVACRYCRTKDRQIITTHHAAERPLTVNINKARLSDEGDSCYKGGTPNLMYRDITRDTVATTIGDQQYYGSRESITRILPPPRNV